jgi:hypothetical protein
MVTLSSGEKVAGHFGQKSFASSDIGERDIYVEEEYELTPKNNWEVCPENVSILISAKEIRCVEFLNSHERNYSTSRKREAT